MFYGSKTSHSPFNMAMILEWIFLATISAFRATSFAFSSLLSHRVNCARWNKSRDT